MQNPGQNLLNHYQSTENQVPHLQFSSNYQGPRQDEEFEYAEADEGADLRLLNPGHNTQNRNVQNQVPHLQFSSHYESGIPRQDEEVFGKQLPNQDHHMQFEQFADEIEELASPRILPDQGAPLAQGQMQNRMQQQAPAQAQNLVPQQGQGQVQQRMPQQGQSPAQNRGAIGCAFMGKSLQVGQAAPFPPPQCMGAKCLGNNMIHYEL